MKKILVALSLLSLTNGAFAQSAEAISSQASIRADVNLAEGRVSPTNYPSLGPTSSIRQLNLRTVGGDLILDFELAPLETAKEFYIVQAPSISLNGRQVISSTYDDFRGNIGRLEEGGNGSIVWVSPLEKYARGNVAGALELTLNVERYFYPPTIYNCEDGPPQFTARQRLPYYAAAGAGVVSLGLGQLFRAQKDDKYNEYLNAGSLDEARPLFDEATRKNDTYRILTLSGVAIITADAVLYLIRNGRYRKQLKRYNEYCDKRQTLNVQPIIEWPAVGPSHGVAGLRLSLAF